MPSERGLRYASPRHRDFPGTVRIRAATCNITRPVVIAIRIAEPILWHPARVRAAKWCVILAANMVSLAPVSALAEARPALPYLGSAGQIKSRQPWSCRTTLTSPEEFAVIPVSLQAPVDRVEQPEGGAPEPLSLRHPPRLILPTYRVLHPEPVVCPASVCIYSAHCHLAAHRGLRHHTHIPLVTVEPMLAALLIRPSDRVVIGAKAAVWTDVPFRVADIGDRIGEVAVGLQPRIAEPDCDNRAVGVLDDVTYVALVGGPNHWNVLVVGFCNAAICKAAGATKCAAP